MEDLRYLEDSVAQIESFFRASPHRFEVIVQAKDGSAQPYRLSFLIAHGLELAEADRDPEAMSRNGARQPSRTA